MGSFWLVSFVTFLTCWQYPKVLDEWVFQSNHPPSEEHSREELIEMLLDMVNKNQEIYSMPKDIKIINEVEYLKK